MGVGVPTPLRDAFDVLGLVPGFDLTVADIRAAYLARAAAAHAGGDESASARLNGAMQQVQDPLTRAGLVLARLGGPSDAADRSTPDGFLGELLDARERAQDARSAGRLQEVQDLLTWAEARRSGEIARVRELLAQVPGMHGQERQRVLAQARQHLNAWRAIERMLEQVAGELDGGARL